ncbi:LTA synthase family protein [Paenisporosarcina antarctica]|uniref:LTA synthase family protein n=1 Tax=Paenisporosarcina antarctica TaxID=417367 RepID=A0A4P7A1J7_9BACL|nr:LTA synthase family protein [Paenisporosarcina antarctica]QBP41776.1 LTA synthase family protein [Paenisporosarcina antarctica]
MKNRSTLLITVTTLIMVITKVFYFRYELFDDMSLMNLLRESFIWLIPYFLVLLFIKKHPIPYLISINLLTSILMILVTWYERYFLIVPSYYDLSQTNQAGSIVEILPYLYAYTDLLYFIDTFILVVAIAIFKKMETPTATRLNTIIIVTSVVFSIIIQSITYNETIYDISVSSKKYGYLNTQISQMMQRNLRNKDEFIEASELTEEFDYPKFIELKNNKYLPDIEHKSFGLAKERHLFVIQVESMQEFVVGEKINNQEITPNINQLLGESTEFTNVIQQIGAGNTSDSEWLLHTSLYPKGLEPTVNFLTGKSYPSMVNYLHEAEYKSMTFHADDITYWNRDVLYPVLGFQDVFTDKEIPNEDVIGFGPSDSILIDFVTEQVKEKVSQNERMYANIMTITSHTPFKMPAKDELLTLPDSYEGSYVGNYLQSVRYTDEQIGRFIQNLKDEGIYENSVIAIFGDHSGLHGRPMTAEDNNLMAELLGKPYSLKDRFTMPFIITVPGVFKNHTINTNLGGQIDMMPTLLNLLGIEIKTPILGQNLFQYKNNLLGMRYYLPAGSFINNDHFYIAENARFPKRFYDIEDMKRIDLDMTYIDKNTTNIQEILNMSDGLMDQYTSKESQIDKK